MQQEQGGGMAGGDIEQWRDEVGRVCGLQIGVQRHILWSIYREAHS